MAPHWIEILHLLKPSLIKKNTADKDNAKIYFICPQELFVYECILLKLAFFIDWHFLFLKDAHFELSIWLKITCHDVRVNCAESYTES